MDTYKVAIPVRVQRLRRPNEKYEAPVEDEEIVLKVIAHGPADAAERITNAISDLLNRE